MTLAHRARAVTTFLMLLSIGMLVLAPAVSADEHDRDRGHDRDRDDRPAAFGVVDRLVSALNKQVTLLEKQDLDDEDTQVSKDDDDGVLNADADREHVRVISLATLTSRLSSANAARATAAVNANTAALQTFLSSGSENAMIVDDALDDAGVARSSALAILPFGDDHLLVITS